MARTRGQDPRGRGDAFSLLLIIGGREGQRGRGRQGRREEERRGVDVGPRLLEERGGGFTPPTELFLSHRGDEEDIREEGDRAEEEEEDKEPIVADVDFAYLPLLEGADEEEAGVVADEEEVDVEEDEGSERSEGERAGVDGEERTLLFPSSLISTSSSVPGTWSSGSYRASPPPSPPSSSPCDVGIQTVSKRPISGSSSSLSSPRAEAREEEEEEGFDW